ncbi:unnamed protein product [Cyclocybe aegerita]|uniref:Galactose mutarotase-like protein n=1 Tax=Cyclocybe aegerita TaxID=1973307 RepID=A0A8S0W013_CYCAE|nr:unnamed protein product [Cyclocybe aegerita]
MAEFKPVLLSLPTSLTPSLVLEILPYGLTIHKLLVQADGRTHDVVIGPESPKDHVTQKYTNSIVGRYANRIPVGTHVLEKKGFKSELKALANESPIVSLHGGPVGFDAVPWTILTKDNPPKLFSRSELSRLGGLPESSFAIFRLISPAGDQGFPGELTVEALIALISPESPTKPITTSGDAEYSLGSVVIVYRAKLEGETKTVTPVNLTQHWGFNLDASLQDGPEPLTIKEHTLTIKADHIAELDSSALGTGNFIAVSTKPAHAHTAKIIGDKFPDAGYDDYYLFSESAQSTIETRILLNSFGEESNYLKDLLRPPDDAERGTRAGAVVELKSKKSGLKLAFDTNQRGAMFYSNALAKATNGARKKIHGGSGVSGDGNAYGPHTAAFLEFHHPLTAFLYPKNKDTEDTLLTSDELYHNYVRCDVTLNPPRPEA